MASVATSRKANGTSAIENAGKSDVAKKPPKAPATSKKVKIRRLPPGMTADECWSILGDEWKVDGGKVDWLRFDAGKVANGPFKESKPATAYLRLLDATQDFTALQQLVRTPGIWQDAKDTFNDPCLRAPPELVVAEFGKVAAGKARIDPRQGTIDTDPTYMAFLQQLTEPITSIRDAELGADDDAAKDKPKVTSTPLVTFIKEKKEAKAKEAAAAKSAKQHARQESSGVGKSKNDDDSKKKGKGKESKSSEKTERASDKGKEKDKQPLKIMTKKAAQQEAAEAANAVADQIAASKAAEDSGAVPKSRRAGIAAAAKLLQRDLGLSPGSAHRRARQDAAKADTTTKPEPAKAPEKEEEKPKEKEKGKERERDRKGKNVEKEEPAVPTGPKVQSTEGSRRSRGKGKAAAATEPTKGKPAAETSKPTTGPIILLKKENTKKEEATPANSASPTTPAQNSTPSNATQTPPTGPKAASGGKGAASSKANQSQKKGAAQTATGATRAFVKHANPSQGVTEALLKQAMEAFGTVTFVEIDKRKGFAYVDFGDQAALAKAIAASPVSIAQGTVQVLERKDKKPAAAAAPAASTTPAAAQSTPTEKAAPESPATATTPTTSEKPKRGRGGRGRRGGGGGKDGANAGDGKGTAAPPAAT
ncbi:hypothetical protein PG996_003168 [Apiospora saccharicola]|uniref:RRM domain-containing protein n=1 Tax=Apiospora saccharicola TaxID=335842 RepID=A0ABR1W4C1_9PEZI